MEFLPEQIKNESDEEIIESILNEGVKVNISFGKSSSPNYRKAVALAKKSLEYIESVDEDGRIIHQAVYDFASFDQFSLLYYKIYNWKSTYVFVNNQLLSSQLIGKLSWERKKLLYNSGEY